MCIRDRCNVLSSYMNLCTGGAEEFEEICSRFLAVAQAFQLEKLHPGIMLPGYLMIAQGWAAVSYTHLDYESVNKAYHKLHEEHVKGRPDIYTDTRELLTKEEFQEIVKSKEYVAVGAKKQEELAGFVIAKRKVTPENPMLKKNHTLYIDAIYVMEKDVYKRQVIRD